MIIQNIQRIEIQDKVFNIDMSDVQTVRAKTAGQMLF